MSSYVCKYIIRNPSVIYNCMWKKYVSMLSQHYGLKKHIFFENVPESTVNVSLEFYGAMIIN